MSNRGRFGSSALIVILMLCVTLGLWFSLASLQRPGASGPLTDPIDLTAFYCGGAVTASGHDPYVAEPLRSCEDAALARSGLPAIPNLVVPVPLPPYALVPFALLSRIDFRAACVLWFLLTLVAVGASAVLVKRMSGLPFVWIVLALSGADAYASLLIGQLVPLIVLALCIAACALRAGRFTLAAIAAACTLVEPHVGVPACAALFVWRPQTRRPLAFAALVLALLCPPFGGAARIVEYLTLVVPAHAAAEAGNFAAQYSLTALLTSAGIEPRLALALGSASWVLMVVVGVMLGGRVASRASEPAYVVLVPPALALIGGPFIHIHQMAVALPLALLLLARAPGARALLVVAVVLLAIPWQTLAELPKIAALFPACAHADAAAALARVADGKLLAERAWGAWVSIGHDDRTPLEQLMFKLPTWFALFVLLARCIRLASTHSTAPVLSEPSPAVPAPVG